VRLLEQLWEARLMVGRLASKVVIVTGGATGIGRAVAGRIVSDGAQ
jgi:NADP-dependent 3-hydroxy acid dehydrogenase YdfG